MDKQVAMIMLNYNGMSTKHDGVSILQLCLKTLLNVDYDNYKLLIADDCSTDDSIGYINSLGSDRIEVLRSDSNINYFSRQNNIAIRHVLKAGSPDYILLLNNDLIFEDVKWLRDMVQMAEQPAMGLVEARDQKGDILSGACLLIKKELLDRIGLLDEGFMFGWETNDYEIRAKQSGFKVGFCDASILHIEGLTTIKHQDITRRKHRFHEDRISMLHFIKKHYAKPLYKRKIRIAMEYFTSCIITKYGSKTKNKGYKFADNKLWRLKESIAVLMGYNT